MVWVCCGAFTLVGSLDPVGSVGARSGVVVLSSES
jgi:hypothetical protein